MKKYNISSRYIDKCIKEIELHCFSNVGGLFHGDDLVEFCTNPKQLYTIHLLEAAGEIYTSRADNSEYPYAIRLESKGMLHSYAKREKQKSSIKGFLVGIISGITVTIGSQLAFSYLISLL